MPGPLNPGTYSVQGTRIDPDVVDLERPPPLEGKDGRWGLKTGGKAGRSGELPSPGPPRGGERNPIIEDVGRLFRTGR
jgi:hypothetical protein